MNSQVRVRDVRPSDGPHLIKAVQESGELHAGWVSPPACSEDFDHWIDQLDGHRRRAFVVERAEGGEITGVVLMYLSVRDQLGIIGYYALSPWQRRGLMQLAVREVLDAYINEHKAITFRAYVDPANEQSGRLLERLGFSPDGPCAKLRYDGSIWEGIQWRFDAAAPVDSDGVVRETSEPVWDETRVRRAR